MGKYKIGITEAGDAGIDLSGVDKLNTVDGAIVISKRFTPEFISAVLSNKDKLIVHATVTGYGGNVLEPFVPVVAEEKKNIDGLVAAGFPKEKIVIRVDPIIPTQKGLERAERVMLLFLEAGYRRYRVSVLDNYPHVKNRFTRVGLPVLYDGNFYPSSEDFQKVDQMLARVKSVAKSDYRLTQSEFSIECCAEPSIQEAAHTGCISAYDLALLGLDPAEADDKGHQRRDCLCYSGKTELLTHKHRCPNGCLYCYWK